MVGKNKSLHLIKVYLKNKYFLTASLPMSLSSILSELYWIRCGKSFTIECLPNRLCFGSSQLVTSRMSLDARKSSILGNCPFINRWNSPQLMRGRHLSWYLLLALCLYTIIVNTATVLRYLLLRLRVSPSAFHLSKSCTNPAVSSSHSFTSLTHV